MMSDVIAHVLRFEGIGMTAEAMVERFVILVLRYDRKTDSEHTEGNQ